MKLPRAWCACGKFRLSEANKSRIEHEGERLRVHEFPRCVILRSGGALDMLSQWIDEAIAKPKRRTR